MEIKGLRILWLTEYYYPNRGGMATSCDRIVQHLRDAGVEVDVCHFSDRRKAWTVKKEIGGTYCCIPPVENPSHTLNLAWRFLQHPDRKRSYTHVLAFGGHLSMLAGPVFAAWWGLPFILCLRGNDFDVGIFSSKRLHILGRAVESAAAVCCVSREKMEKVRAFWPESQAYFTPNGADLQDWQALPSQLEQAQTWREKVLQPGQKVLGLIGALKAKKGLDLLLEALDRPSLKDKVHLLLVGELEEGKTEYLDEQAFAYTHIPFMDRYELLSWYPACEGVALPSWYDGMPNVALEAMGLGIPVIGSRVDGIEDLLGENWPEFLFPAGDVEACRQVLRHWLDLSPERQKQLQNSLPQHLKEHFSTEQETRNYLEIFSATAKS